MNSKAARKARFRRGLIEALGKDDVIFGQFSEIQKTADAALQSYWGKSDPKPKLKKIIKQAEKLLAALEEKENTPVAESQQGH